MTTERSGTNNNYDYKHSVIFDVLLQGVDWKVVSNVNCSKKETHSDYSREDFVINDKSDLFCTYIGVHILCNIHTWSLEKFAISRI